MMQSVWVILYNEHDNLTVYGVVHNVNNMEWTIYIKKKLSYFVQDVMERLVKADVNK